MDATIRQDGEVKTIKEGETFPGFEAETDKVTESLNAQFIQEVALVSEQIIGAVKIAALDYTSDNRVGAAGISLAFLNCRHFFPEGAEFFDKGSEWAKQYFDANVPKGKDA